MLTDDEVRMVLAVDSRPDVAALLRTAAVTGASPAELVALTWSDIDWKVERIHLWRRVAERGRLRPTKARAVDVDDTVLAALERHSAWSNEHGWWCGDAHFVWPACPVGCHPAAPASFAHAIRGAFAEAGVDGSLRRLREWHGALLLTHGIAPRDVAQRLGHSAPSVTARMYREVLGDAGRAAAEVARHVLA